MSGRNDKNIIFDSIELLSKQCVYNAISLNTLTAHGPININ